LSVVLLSNWQATVVVDVVDGAAAVCDKAN